VERVGEHPVPAGPLAVRWLGYELGRVRAGLRGAARVLLENAGSAPWRSHGEDAGVHLSYHWLDDRENPIVWDGPRSVFERPVQPGESVEVAVGLRGPQPPGRYLLSFDLVEEHRFWFAEIGSSPLVLAVEVEPRIDERRLRVVVHGGPDEETAAALAAQDEAPSEGDAVATAHLVAGARPAPDWSRRILDAHAEGFAAVGGSLRWDAGRLRRRGLLDLEPWSRPGRSPQFELPLLLPSLLDGLEPGEHGGLPAYAPDGDETWIYDGRAAITLRPRRGRRPA